MERRAFLKTLTKAIVIITVIPVALVQAKEVFNRKMLQNRIDFLKEEKLIFNEPYYYHWEKLPVISGKITRMYPGKSLMKLTEAIGKSYGK